MSDFNEASMITEEMRAIVGEVLETEVSFPIAASDIRKWALAVYYPQIPPRIFWDEDYAAESEHGGIVAPEEFNPFAWMTKVPLPEERPYPNTGFEALLGVEPPAHRASLQQRVAARYSSTRMRPGDVIRSTRRITEYFERVGRMGLQLYATVSLEYTNQDDEWIKTLDTVFVRYR